MKEHFDEAWNQYDVNGDGSISLEESHTFMRSLMGRLNNFVLAQGSVSDINSTPLNNLIEEPKSD
jgi:Ca2+-binding EF-hand superfamily protein